MSVLVSSPSVSTLVGTPKEVKARLGRSQAEQVLVLAFDHIKPAAFKALAENFTNVASSMFEVLQERLDKESLERLAEVLVPRTPPSPRLLKEAAMLVQARTAVLESGDWLSAADVAQLAGLSTRNPSAQPNKWKKQGQIFCHQSWWRGLLSWLWPGPGYQLPSCQTIGSGSGDSGRA